MTNNIPPPLPASNMVYETNVSHELHKNNK